METNRILRGFCINGFGIGRLHYISSRSDFGFEFLEIFIFEKRLPDSTIRESATLRINDTRSQRLSNSTIRGVDDSPHHWYTESTTPRITDTESRLLNFLKENSLYRWYGESGSRRLCVLLILRVADSPYCWVRESLVEKKTCLASIFSTLNGWSMTLKDQFGQKLARDVIYVLSK